MSTMLQKTFSPRPLVRGGATLVAVAVMTGGCATSGSPSGPSMAGSAAEPAATAPNPHGMHSTSAPATALSIRSALEMQLGEHVRLTVQLMRDRIAGVDRRTDATVDAVDRNATELTRTIGALYDEEAANAFGQLWASHVRQLQDYAASLADADDAAARTARSRLVTTERDIGRLLSSAVRGALTPQQVEDVIRMHVDTLLSQADAYAAGDYAKAYQVARECFAHMIMAADTLAGPIATSRGLPTAELQTARRLLQSELARLLAEHMGLLGETMRTAADAADEFPAAADSLNANTADLAAAVGALYGDAASDGFLAAWAGHVNGLVDYARATARDDEPGRQAAASSVDRYAPQVAAFLSTAVAGRLRADALTAELAEHDHDLTAATDAYAAQDYSGAQQRSADGYRHMFDLAETLAIAVGEQVAGGLPRGGAQTGGGGSAQGR